MSSIHNILNVGLIYEAPAYSEEETNETTYLFDKIPEIFVCVDFYIGHWTLVPVKAYSIMCFVVNPQHVVFWVDL